MAKKDGNKPHFRKEIAGFNITDQGVNSWGKTIRIGPFAITPNLSDGEFDMGWSIPGTGIYQRKVIKHKFKKLAEFFEPEPDFGHKEPMWDDEPPTPPVGDDHGNH